MKLHLPVFLRKSLFSCFALVAGCTLSSGTLAFADDLVLGAGDTLSIDYAAADSIPDLENGTLQLDGDALLQLLNCGSGDGKTYALATGVSGLVDAEGNPISLDSTNNAISNYFDTTRPGAGFWAGGTLQLNNGALQMVLHNKTVKEALEITKQETWIQNYSYYKSIFFHNISSGSDGGAIYGGAEDSPIILSNSGSVVFSGNTASSTKYVSGGAIALDTFGKATLSKNGSVEFTGNSSSGAGGAIAAPTGSTMITLSNNGRVTFTGNMSKSGGAIFLGLGDTLTLSNNGSVTFSGNTATCDSPGLPGGGAINAEVDGKIVLTDNGSVVFCGNSSKYGGAIYGDFDLSIRNNDMVLFEKNVERPGNSYRLTSIATSYIDSTLSLSVAAGKSIEFRDSVRINTMKLNEDYTDAEGKLIKQEGDIIFTGKYTESHLNEILAADGAERTADAEEIRLSRTTKVNALTNLYGGRLRVEDGAIYQGQGIMAHAGSESTVLVKDATLSHEGYTLEFNAGTTLEVAGDSTICGHVNLLADSLFKLEQGATLNLYESNDAALSVGGLAWLEGASTLNADLTLAEGASLDMVFLDAGAVAVNGVLTFGGQVSLGENLLALLAEKQGHEGSITLFTGLENVDWATVTGNAVSDCVWAGAVFSNMAGNYSYYLNYASDTGSLVIQIVPEPATATLSLLALTALAMRRRRK